MDLNFGKKVLCATEERLRSKWKFKEIDDRGILSTTGVGVYFKGKRNGFEMSKIQNAYMAKESPNFALAVTGPLIWTTAYFIMGFLLRLIFEGSYGFFLDIELSDILCVIAGSVITVFRSLFRPEIWICVEYRSSDGRSGKAFFRRLPFRNSEVLLNQLRKLTSEKE